MQFKKCSCQASSLFREDRLRDEGYGVGMIRVYKS